MKKKLSLLIYSLAGGGAERVVSILLSELQEQYDVTLVLMRNKIDYDLPKETKIHFIEHSDPNENGIVKFLKLPYLGWRYKKFCRNNKIEVSLAFTNRPSYIAILSKIFGNRAYNIISERTTPSMIYKQNNLISKVSKFLIKNLYPKADLIISNSVGNRMDLIDNFDISGDRVVTIPNLFDLEKIDRLSSEPVDSIDFNKFTFITAGRLDRGKNHQIMIDAFAQLEENATQLIILGEGEERRVLEEKIVKLKLADRVFLLGFDSNPYKYFSKSDVFLFSSNYEGFPNVLVEALSCSLPVISTDCKSGPREILAPESDIDFQLESGVEKSKYGILVGTNNTIGLSRAMQNMLKDEKMYVHYKNIGKQRALDFGKNKILKKWKIQIESF